MSVSQSLSFVWVFFKYILFIMLLQLSHFFFHFIPSALHHPSLQHFPLSSCPWVVHTSSLAFPFPIPFLTSPCLFCTYHLCFLSPLPFPPFSPHTTDNPPCDLYFRDSAPVLVVCLVSFCFYFSGSVVDSCEFVVILLFIFLMFFFLDNSL